MSFCHVLAWAVFPSSTPRGKEILFYVDRSLFIGFTHSAFVFGCESTVDKSAIEGKDVPIGALVSFIQKGFQLMELEANLNDEGTDVYGKYASLTARDILTKDLDELREVAREMQLKEEIDWDEIYLAKETGKTKLFEEKNKPVVREFEVVGENKRPKVLASKVVGCPKLQLVASLHGDGEVCLWNFADGGTKKPYMTLKSKEIFQSSNDSSVKITRVAWSPDRNFIAVASDNGIVSVCTDDGTVVGAALKPRNLCRPTALKWSRSSTFISVGLEDGSVTVWDAKSAPSEHGRHQHWWHFPASGTETEGAKGAVSNLDWRDDEMFAVSLDNGEAFLVSVESDTPISLPVPVPDQTIKATDASRQLESTSMDVDVQVNACSIRWDPSGCRLAVGYSNALCAVWNMPKPPKLTSNRERDAWLDMSQVPQPKLLEGKSANSEFLCWCGSHVVLVGGKDGTVQAWNVDSHGAIPMATDLVQKDCRISAMASVEDKGIVAIGTSDGNVFVWRLRNGKMEMTRANDKNDPSPVFDVVYDVQLGSQIMDLAAIGTDNDTCSPKIIALCMENPNIYVIQG